MVEGQQARCLVFQCRNVMGNIQRAHRAAESFCTPVTLPPCSSSSWRCLREALYNPPGREAKASSRG